MRNQYLIFTAILFSLLCSGCLKDIFKPEKYFFSCTFYGEHLIETKDRDSYFLGLNYMQFEIPFLYIHAQPEGNDVFVSQFNIRMRDSIEFEPNTVYSNMPADGVIQPQLEFGFSYYFFFGSSYRSASLYEMANHPIELKPFFVKIEDITDTYLSGTFYGTIYKHNYSGATTFEVSYYINDGKFKVPRR